MAPETGDGMTDATAPLTLVKELFQALSKGKHLCTDDGDLYFALHRRYAEYETLFRQLGFALRRHPRNFFYFDGDDVGEVAQRIAVFFYILVEHIGDRGLAVEEAIMTKEWKVSDLPHFSTERYRDYMQQVGVTSPDDLHRLVISRLESFGFSSWVPPEHFRFRAAAYRLLDLCIAAAGAANETPPTGAASG